MSLIPSRAALNRVLDAPLLTNEQVAAKLAHAGVRLHQVGNDADLRARAVAAGCRLDHTSGDWHAIRHALHRALIPAAEIVRADRIADPLDPAYQAALAAEGRHQARRRGDAANERVRGLVERVHRAGGLEPPPAPAFGDCEE